MPRLQCLFCQHLNPADVDYCNNCDGQLNLQPCDRCDAVDLRTATNCYKCGAAFSLPVAPALVFPFTPAVADKEFTDPTPINPGVADSEAGHLSAGQTYSHPERQPADDVLSPETSATAAELRRGTPVAILTTLLLLITTAAAVYLYRGHTAQPVLTQGQKQAVVDAPGASKPGEAAPSNRAAGTDAPLKSTNTAQKTTSANKSAKTPSITQPGVEAARADHPSPAIDTEITTPQDLSRVGKCPPAVATLGLCNPDIQQEKP